MYKLRHDQNANHNQTFEVSGITSSKVSFLTSAAFKETDALWAGLFWHE
jgi:hypothetical protein